VVRLITAVVVLEAVPDLAAVVSAAVPDLAVVSAAVPDLAEISVVLDLAAALVAVQVLVVLDLAVLEVPHHHVEEEGADIMAEDALIPLLH
jgi:hypothetical protein